MVCSTIQQPNRETYSEDTVSRLASMYTAASDFKIFWDNAYFCHHLDNDQYKVKDILKECKRNNTSERPFLFTSTSKVTHAGSGVSVIWGSKKNIDWYKKRMSAQTAGYDKVNQLRHAKFSHPRKLFIVTWRSMRNYSNQNLTYLIVC